MVILNKSETCHIKQQLFFHTKKCYFFENFIIWNICWRLINILFLYFTSSIAFWGKYEYIVSVKIRFSQVTAVFLNFLVVTSGHWLKFEFSTIFETEVVFWFLKIKRLFVWRKNFSIWNSSGNFTSPPNVKQRKICAKENWSGFVLLETREVHKYKHSHIFSFYYYEKNFEEF